ncbi:MAG: DUF4167 domain-containing protein, partial [Alphaproteobacteria bacterium]|nr:DUF4167 domain-containing protein [Alphaproteobacteria bacterium]
GGNQGNQGNRSLESNGPEVKIRGTAAQIYEKYSQYARDAQSAGDRVKTENYLQHAEHYFRIMATTMPREQRIQQSETAGFNNGDDRDADDNVRDPMKVVDDGDEDDASDGFEAGGTSQQRDRVDARGNDRPNERTGERPNEREAADRNQDRASERTPERNSDRQAQDASGVDAAEDEEAGGDDRGEGQGRRRRRQRRRPQDGEGGERAGGERAGGDPEARSALDALAQKQAAVAGG